MSDAHDGKTGPELITLWVVVPVAVHAAAEHLASAYAKGGAEEVCAAVLHGLAEADAGLLTMDANLLGRWISCHPWTWPHDGGASGKGGA